MSGSDLRCVLRFLSPNARETASCPFTLATSPDITHRKKLLQNKKQQ